MSGTDSMANVTLRPWPAATKEALSGEELFQQVQQLFHERGHPRGITEQALQGEIDAGKNASVDAGEELERDQKKDAPSKKERLEEINRARGEMYQKLEWAAFAGGNAMNLINLILSKDPTKAPDAGYTPMFKQANVPSGSFGVAKGGISAPEEVDPDITKRRRLAMKGSRMEALDWATDGLLKAATDLENEVRKETKYWDEVLSISEKGWALQRTQKNARTAPFAVRYGLPEASNHFKARGLAPLRMDKDGGIILDPNLALKPKTVRVRMSDNGSIIGTSHLPAQSDLSDIAVEQSIQLARDSLFEEELFHELSMESRQLLGYGVELRSSVIHITTPSPSGRASHRKVLIDCVDRDEKIATGHDQSQEWLAQGVAEALRLLLAHEHRMRLHRRSQLPAPLAQQKRQQPSPPFLRTLLGMFSHLDAVNSLHAYLDAIAKTLDSAGLKLTVESSRETSWAELTEVVEQSYKKDLSATDSLLAVFTRPFEGQASLSLPSSGAQPEFITIATRTHMGQPHFGAEHRLTLPPALVKVFSLAPDQQRQFKFSSTEDVKSYLDWILSLDLAHALLFKDYSGRSVVRSTQPQVSILSKGSTKGRAREDEVAIQLENAALKVTATATAKLHLATGASVETFTWDGHAGHASLRDKVKSWIG